MSDFITHWNNFMHNIFIYYFGDISELFAPPENENTESTAEYFAQIMKKRDDFIHKHDQLLGTIYMQIHWNFKFELDVRIAREIVNQTATFAIDGNPITMPIIQMIRNMFIIHAGLRFETAEAIKDYIEESLVDYNENAATLFLIEMMCTDNANISFQTKVEDEEIECAIREYTNEPEIQPAGCPLAISGRGNSLQIFDLPDKTRFQKTKL
jgi:hypothetical protein